MAALDRVNTWIFDMDNTLYNADTHVFVEMKRLMMKYMERHLGLDAAAANALRDRLWHRHGSTLRGLMSEYDIDPHQFLRETHGIDVTPVPPCPVLREKIAQLPGRKIVYTNSTQPFARKMIAHLGLDALFEDIHAIEDADFLPKPNPVSYDAFVKRYSVDSGTTCMFEDSEQNLKPAHALGWSTVWICGGGEESAELPYVQHRAATLKDWLVQHVR